MADALKDILIKRIDAMGPMTIADYMRECLMHPKHGYYQQKKVFGRDGDFITAPEVSQMFGEIIGIWLVQEWQRIGAPNAVNIVELGPGRGTLMADLRRTIKAVPEIDQAAKIHFVEMSSQLREKQREKHPDATWHDDLSSLPTGPSIIIANEFFDALPIHQYLYRNNGWSERVVATDSDGQLTYGIQPPGPQLALLSEIVAVPEDNTLYEVSPQSITCAGDIAAHIKENQGSVLIIDYGYMRSIGGDTFQALQKHEYVDPLDAPGDADLTAHVAFDQLAAALSSKGTSVAPIEIQGQFLMQHGLGVRAQKLSAGQIPQVQTKVVGELKRLTAPDEMGDLFKVLVARA